MAEKANFEKALEELENIADELASGRLSIDEAIKKYEDATKAYKRCHAMLDKASKRIKILTEENGRLKTGEQVLADSFDSGETGVDEE